MEKTLQEEKREALNTYIKAREAYLQDWQDNDKWIAFCDAKKNCMMLGVRI